MCDWLMDAAAGLGLIVFIGSAFLLAGAAPALIGALLREGFLWMI